MAAVSLLGAITFDTNAGTHTVVATPALGDLIVLVVANTTYTGNTLPTDNNADGRGTYVLAESRVKAASADTMQFYIRSELVGRAASTTFTHAVGAGTSGGGLAAVKITGMWKAGAAAKVKSGGQDNGAAAATPAPSWTGGGAASGTNPLVGAIFNATSPATMTKPASFDSELGDVGYATPTTGLEVVSDNTGNTDSTVTWGSTSASAFCSAILELDAREVLGMKQSLSLKVIQAVQRSAVR